MTAAPHADALILFGISGDLAHKKLLPALYHLTAQGQLDMPIVGVASCGRPSGERGWLAAFGA